MFELKNYTLSCLAKGNEGAMPVPVAAGSKASVCGRSLVGIVGSNPSGGHGCPSRLSVVCCQVEFPASD